MVDEALPLHGLRVVELAHLVAGPACGQLLAELGAEVIKVESPTGDIARRLGPQLGTSGSALFSAANRGKRSVCLDLTRPADAARTADLVAGSDVLITNLDQVLLNRSGLDDKTVRSTRPNLIYVTIGGFADPPRPATDGLVQAAMGLMSMTGPERGETFRVGPSIVDVSTATWALIAILIAVDRRRRTGNGDSIRVNLADVGLFMQFTHLAMYACDPAAVRRMGNKSPVACTPTFAAADGRFMVSIVHDQHWQAFCAALNQSALASDSRFDSNVKRMERQEEIESLIQREISGRERGYWLSRLEARDVPCAPERTYAEVTADPELIKRGLIYRIPGDIDERLIYVRPPMFFEELKLPAPRVAPDLGGPAADSAIRS